MDEYDDEVGAVHQSVLHKRETGSIRNNKKKNKNHSSASPLYRLPLISSNEHLQNYTGKETQSPIPSHYEQQQQQLQTIRLPQPTTHSPSPSRSSHIVVPPPTMQDLPLLPDIISTAPKDTPTTAHTNTPTPTPTSTSTSLVRIKTRPKICSPAASSQWQHTLSRADVISPSDNVPQDTQDAASLAYNTQFVIEDPVTYFAKNRDGPIKFVYLNKVHTPKLTVENPYKLKMVPFKDIDKDYYTMSANGITHIRADGYSDFTSLVSWVREADLFNVISQFDVFKNYRYWKAFRKWLSYVRKRRLKANRHMLESSLFTHKRIFRKYLLEVVKLCESDLMKIELLPVKPHANYLPSDFVNAQNTHRRHIKDTLSTFYHMLTELVERMCSEVCDPERTKISEDDFTLKTRRKVSLRQLMLIERQKALEKSRVTDQVNNEIKMISNFIRLCDYIIVEFLVKLSLSEFDHFLSVLQTEKSTVFCTEVLFNSEGAMIFSPDCGELKFLIHECISDLNNLLNALPRLAGNSNTNFEKYIQMYKIRPESSPQQGLNSKAFVLQSPEYHEQMGKIDEVIDRSFEAAAVYAKNFNEFRSVHQFGKQWNIENYNQAEPDLELFASELAKFREWAASLEKIQTSSTRGILFIDSKALKASLTPIPTRAMSDLKTLLATMAADRTQKLLDLFRNSIKSLASEPTSLEEYVDFVEFLVPLPNKAAHCGQVIQLVDDIYALLDESDASVSPADLEKHSLIHTIFVRFKESLTTAQASKQKMFSTHSKTLEKYIASHNASTQAITLRLSADSFSDPGSPTKSLLIELADIRSQVIEVQAKIDKYTKWHAILGLPATSAASTINEAASQLDQTQSLWETVDKWQQLMDSYNTMPFTTLNKADIARDIDTIVVKASDLLTNDPKNAVALNLMERVDQYRKILPSILELANASIKPRHWSRLFEAVGRHYDEETVFSLSQLTEYNILSRKDLISDISALATGEYELENKLRMIEESWERARVEIIPYHSKAKNVFVLAGVSTLLATAYEHEIMLTNMLSSEYIIGIRSAVEGMKNKLAGVTSVLDSWLNCQQKWESLVPIFAQYEVQRQLSAQTNKFRVVDRRWRATIRNAQRDTRVLSIISSSGLMSTLTEANKVMSLIIQDLDSYLDSKRAVFPRFFFLTNDDLFAIVSKIHSPTTIQHYFSKCFDNIKCLTFNDDQSEVNGMVSISGEFLLFDAPIQLSDTLVESWLSATETSMRRTLRDQMNKALLEYNRRPLLEWLGDYPSQIIYAVIQIVWTRNVHIALDKEEPAGPLQLYREFLHDRLQSLATVLETGSLSPQQQQIVQSIMLIDQQCYTITGQLKDAKIHSSHDCEWTKHMRFYWDDKKHTCFVKQSNNTIPYGFEFQGLMPRDHVNLGTDRYLLSLTNSLRSALGCSVIGANESVDMVRELARSMGRLFVSFCCVAAAPSSSILRFLCAVSQIGAWGGFLNFDCMKPEVKSQACQYLNSIYLAISERTEKLVLENKTIQVDENCGLFLFLLDDDGRPPVLRASDLPEELNRIFRPVHIMQPEYKVGILSCLAASGGFSREECESLSDKLFFIHTTMGEIFPDLVNALSLRSVRSVVLLASALRNTTESSVAAIIQAIKMVHLPALKSEMEQQTFFQVLQAAFPSCTTVQLPTNGTQTLEEMISDMVQREYGHPSTALVTKMMMLYNSLCHHKSVILAGGPQTGKTTAYTVLSKLLPQWSKAQVAAEFSDSKGCLGCSEVKTYNVYPHALSDEDLYGEYDSGQESWSEGLVQSLLKQVWQQQSDETNVTTVHGNDTSEHVLSGNFTRHWIIFDGPLYGSWLSPLFHLLDSASPCLSLPSGDKVSIPESLHILFESATLTCSHPGMIGRSAVVAFSDDALGWRDVYSSWLHFATFPHDYSSVIKKTIAGLFDDYISAALSYTKKLSAATSSFRPSDKNLVQSLCLLLDKLLKDAIAPNPVPLPTPSPSPSPTPTSAITRTSLAASTNVVRALLDQQQPIEISIRAVFIFSIVWGIGGYLCPEGRLEFDKWIKSKMDVVKIWGVPATDTQTVYDYGFDTSYYGKGVVVRAWNRLNIVLPSSGSNLPPATPSSYLQPTPDFSQYSVLPTDEMLRMSFLLPPILLSQRPVLLVGPRSSGKSTIVSNVVRLLSSKGYYQLPVDLSHYSSAATIEATLEVGMEKKLKNVIGASLGKTVVAYITHLELKTSAMIPYAPNHPSTSTLSVIEWLRQLMSINRYYKRKENFLMAVKDLVILGSISSDKWDALRTNPTIARLLDRFLVVHVPAPGDSDVRATVIPALRNFLLAFDSPELLQVGNALVEGSIVVRRALASTLLPSSALRVHYHFGFGELVRVFRGILRFNPSSKSDTLPKLLLVKLWRHEMTREFCDGLMDAHDREFFYLQMRVALENLGFDILTLDDVVFGDFSKNRSNDTEYAECPPSHVKNLLKVVVDDDDITTQTHYSTANQQVVLLNATVNHVSQLVRTFRREQGHVLLLGPTGSGKVQTVKLAARLIGIECHTIALASNVFNDQDFVQEIKRIIISAASVGDKPVVILCGDEVMTSNELFLERICGFLDIKVLPLVFLPSEISTIIQEVRLEALASGHSSHPDDILTYFLENIRKNIHIVLCMNPCEDSFAERMLKYPVLSKWMAIDWYGPWCQDDRYTLASGLLKSEPGSLDFALSVEAICQMLIYMHGYASQLVMEATKESLLRPHPPSNIMFVELVKTFLNIFKKKKEDMQRRMMLLKSALKKTEEVRRDAETIELELAATRPQLTKAVEDTTKLEEAIAKNSKVVSDFWKVVHAEEMAVTAKGTETVYLEAEVQKAQAALDAHLPVLDSALSAVTALTKQDISELHGLGSVPALPDRILRVMEAICALKDVKPSADELKNQLDLDLAWFSNFDKKRINLDVQNKLKKLTQHPEFTPNGMEPKAARAICAWVLAIYKYTITYEATAPKRDKVSDLSSKLDQSQKALKEKREALALVEEKLAQFNKVFKASNDKKEKLERKVQSLSVKLNRSERFSASITGSEEVWQAEMKNLELMQDNLARFSLIVAGFVVYMGIHTHTTRQAALADWTSKSDQLGLQGALQEIAVQSAVDASQLRQWYRSGLPKDTMCIHTAVITSLSLRWPLLIDPHGIARKWIKGSERANQLRVLQPTQHDFVRALENAVATGRVVYIDHAVSDDGLLPSVLSDLLSPIANESSNLPTTVRIVNEVNYNKKFKLYLGTRLARPHLHSLLHNQVNVIDFNVGRDVIEYQLLSYALHHDAQQHRPKEKDKVVPENEKGHLDRDREQELQEHRDHLLMAMSTAEGDVLDNETLITMLCQTAQLMDIHRDNVDGHTLDELPNVPSSHHDGRKELLKAFASRGALLYEIVSSLHLLNPLYQFSLHQFMSVFKSVILKSPLMPVTSNNSSTTTANASHERASASSPKPTSETTGVGGNSMNPTRGTASTNNSSITSIDPQAWLATLLVKLNQAVFSDIGKSLFVRHRKVFAFLLATRIQHQAGYIGSAEWNSFLTTSTSDASSLLNLFPPTAAPDLSPPPAPDLTPIPLVPRELDGLVPWHRVVALDQLLPGLIHSFITFPVQWQQFILSNEYLSTQPCPPLPDGWDDKVTVFQRLLLLLVTCEHKLMPEIHEFINNQLGVQFISPEPIEFDRALIASTPLTPIVIMTPERNAVDAISNLSKFVHEQGKSDKFVLISLGDDVEKLNQPTSTVLLSQALTQGNWVFVDHIYRNPSWLVNVEHALDSASAHALAVATAAAATMSTSILPSKPAGSNYQGHSLNSDFRLWLHCVETLDSQVPISILQKGIKLAIEQPNTIKTLLSHIYSRMDERLFGSTSKKTALLFRRLVFVLCFFHASVLVRNEYSEHCGGWGGKLQFSETDLALGIETIRSKLAEHEERNEEVAFAALQYTIVEIIYGGHVSTPWDLNALRQMLTDLLAPLAAPDRRGALHEDKLSIPSLPQAYSNPPDSSLGLDAYLRSLPVYDSSLAVGLSENVSKEFLRQATQNFMADLSVLSLSEHVDPPCQAGDDIVSALRYCIPQDVKGANLPTISSDNLWLMVAQQEFARLSTILTSIQMDLRLVVTMGAASSCDSLELSTSIRKKLVPNSWQQAIRNVTMQSLTQSNKSMTPQLAWLTQVVARWSYFRMWLQSSRMPNFISLDFFDAPKSVFSCILHSYAHKKSVPVDRVLLVFQIHASSHPSTNPLPSHPPAHQPSTTDHPPTTEDSTWLCGVILTGAAWDNSKGYLHTSGNVFDYTNTNSNNSNSINVNSTSSSCITIFCYATLKTTPTPADDANLSLSSSTQTPDNTYLCPMFQGMTRTAHTLITHIPIPISPSDPPQTWAKRCVSMHVVSAI